MSSNSLRGSRDRVRHGAPRERGPRGRSAGRRPCRRCAAPARRGRPGEAVAVELARLDRLRAARHSSTSKRLAGTSMRGSARRGGGWRGRCAASAGSRPWARPSGSRDRHCPSRCRDRARRSPLPPAGCRPPSPPRPYGAARRRGCRGQTDRQLSSLIRHSPSNTSSAWARVFTNTIAVRAGGSCCRPRAARAGPYSRLGHRLAAMMRDIGRRPTPRGRSGRCRPQARQSASTGVGYRGRQADEAAAGEKAASRARQSASEGRAWLGESMHLVDDDACRPAKISASG